MNEDIEIMLSCMMNEANGDATLCPLDREPDFYDVEVRRLIEETGEIEVLDERSDIKDYAEAQRFASEMEAKYPGAYTNEISYC